MGKAGAVAAMLGGMAELYRFSLSAISTHQVLIKIPSSCCNAEAAYLSSEISLWI